MPSSFNALPIFSSGPHRFRELTQGEYILLNARVNPFQAGSQPVGPLELAVIVTGRLVAANESDLWALRDAVTSLLTDPPTIADLFDDAGHRWQDISLTNFTPADRTDRGRQTSLAYQMTFIKFL